MRSRGLTVMGLILMAGVAHAGGDLLVNGGFEQPAAADGSIPGWSANGPLAQQQVTLDADAHSGAGALCILSTHATEQASVLSQRVPVAPGRDYQLTLRARRDSFVYGTEFRVVLRRGDAVVGQQPASFRSATWSPVILGFNSGEADSAEVQLITPNIGNGRITVGRRLWVDDVALVAVDHARDIEIPGAGASAAAEVEVPDPGRYHLWARVRCAGDNRFTLSVGGQEREFRAYTPGAWYWVRPVIPELLLREGRQRIAVSGTGAAVAIERVVLTMDPFWRPDDFVEFTAPEQALAAQGAAGFTPVERGTVAFTVTGDLPPGRWGVSQGVPFARGVLADVGQVRIADRPVQAEALNRWPDGSVKWLLLSTRAAAGETLTLAYGSAVTPAPADRPTVSVEETADEVRVDTGALSFAVPRAGAALLRDLTDGERTIASVVGVVNERFTTAGPREVTVEEAGPVRAAVRISGEHRDAAGAKLLDYVVRVFAYAGERHVRVEHSFVLRDDLVSIDIDSLTLRLVTPVGRALFEGEVGVATADGPATLSAALASAGSATCDRPWRVEQAGVVVAEGTEADGRLAVSGPGEMVLAIHDFARNAPKTLTVDGDRVDLGLVGGPLEFFKGMMKTHEFVLALGEGAAQAADAFAARPLLLVSPEYCCGTRATGHWPLPEDGAFPGYEHSVAVTIADWDRRQRDADRRPDFAGMLNCGDARLSEGGNNLESALAEGAMVQFLRTGRRDWFDYADVSVRHFADIDIDHSDSSGGLIWRHGPHRREGIDPAGAGVNGHSWYNGTVLYGLFTGSRRILDTAPAVGDYYARWPLPPREYLHYWRRIAWKLMDEVQAFEVTGAARHLDAALEDVRVTSLQRDHLVTLWPYMYAVGMKGLRMYYDATADPDVRELYLQLMDGFMRLRARPDDTVNGEWPRAAGQLLGNFPNDRSCAFYDEGAWATWLSGDERYARAAGEDLAFQITFGITDPTLLWGSADLLRAMREVGIAEPALTAKLPGAFMTAPPPDSPLRRFDRPAIAFQVNEAQDGPFAIELLKTSYGKYTHDYEAAARLYAPDGALVQELAMRTRGLRTYALQVPADGQTGTYLMVITVDDPWRWTLDQLDLELDAGEHTLRICPRYDREYLDAVCIARAGEYFPALQGDPPAGSMILQAEDGRLPEGYEVVGWNDALGGRAVRALASPGDDGPSIELPFTVEQAGTYRFFAREWQGYADLLNVQIDDGPRLQCKQSHDMKGNPYPVWSIATTLGEDAIVPYCIVSRANLGQFDHSTLRPHPALADRPGE